MNEACYWSTGITIAKAGGGWQAQLLLRSVSLEGVLLLRNTGSPSLSNVVDAVKSVAERLGVEFYAVLAPRVFCERDGHLDDGDHPELRQAANEQAVRLGWAQVYKADPPEEMRLWWETLCPVCKGDPGPHRYDDTCFADRATEQT